MIPLKLSRSPSLNGIITIPGDKSIAHRALILSSLSFGTTVIDNLPDNDDCRATIDALRQFGVHVTVRETSPGVVSVVVNGRGSRGFEKPSGPIFIDSSGTTFRLLLGVAAGQLMTVTFEAGVGLSSRPMLRVTHPLRMMGAGVTARLSGDGSGQEEYPPVEVTGGVLKGISYTLPVASAQVKSALLLAGLNAEGTTSLVEPVPTRDHTERMLQLFKAPIRVVGNTVSIDGGAPLQSPGSVCVPGDISSAAFFFVLGALCPASRVTVKRVSLNPSRTGIISVLRRMKADVSVATDPDCAVPAGAEPAADITARTSFLKGTVIEATEVPSLVDEIPLLMVAACLAQGESRFRGVQELRMKETDRISSMQENLRLMGADIEVVSTPTGEDVIIKGTGVLRGALVKSSNDHRTAMSMIVAGMVASGETILDDSACINKSFPGFVKIVQSLTAR
jgi:3-phosphoshikimate 1-carboxyvinyltransferase